MNKVLNQVLQYLFPKFCVSCQTEGAFLCMTCKKEILLVKTQVCPNCQRISPLGRFCKACKKEKFLKGIIVASYYEEGPLKEIIHNFKYNSVVELKDVLGEILVSVKLPRVDLVTFVPLHKRRLAERGYNQAEILAGELTKTQKSKFKDLLIKTKHTKRQVGLIGRRRRINLKNVFKIKERIDIKNKKVVIIDDITTTGTTLNECARVLKEAGGKEVWGLVVAQG